MKKKWIAGFMAALCLSTCTACDLPFDLPFLNGEDSSSVSMQEEVKNATVEQTTEDMVVIRILEETDAKLIDVMTSLQADEQLAFTQDSQGMITSVNGKVNAADWSASWMVYTSDTELSSTEWLSYDYNGENLGLAAFGADLMPVKKGEIYIWAYTTF